ncbi:MAG: hypothetical protein WCO33_00660 [bacterium]
MEAQSGNNDPKVQRTLLQRVLNIQAVDNGEGIRAVPNEERRTTFRDVVLSFLRGKKTPSQSIYQITDEPDDTSSVDSEGFRNAQNMTLGASSKTPSEFFGNKGKKKTNSD